MKIQFEKDRLQSCERGEMQFRGPNRCFDQEQRCALIIALLTIHHDGDPNVHRAICALNATSSPVKVRERFWTCFWLMATQKIQTLWTLPNSKSGGYKLLFLLQIRVTRFHSLIDILILHIQAYFCRNSRVYLSVYTMCIISDGASWCEKTVCGSSSPRLDTNAS